MFCVPRARLHHTQPTPIGAPKLNEMKIARHKTKVFFFLIFFLPVLNGVSDVGQGGSFPRMVFQTPNELGIPPTKGRGKLDPVVRYYAHSVSVVFFFCFFIIKSV